MNCSTATSSMTTDESYVYYRRIEDSPSWVEECERPSTAVHRMPFEPKSLFCVFFIATGPILIYQVPRGHTVNSNYYRTNCLEPLVKHLRTKRPSSGTHAIKLHFDN